MINVYLKTLQILEKIFMPLLVLFMRFWMAKIFWYSGLTKISDWETAIYLFQKIYKVPVIPPEVAAYLTTAAELTCPIFLMLGLATRFATIPMLIMTAVIEFTYLSLADHSYWAMLLLTILFYGPGMWSLDYLIQRKWGSVNLFNT